MGGTGDLGGVFTGAPVVVVQGAVLAVGEGEGHVVQVAAHAGAADVVEVVGLEVIGSVHTGSVMYVVHGVDHHPDGAVKGLLVFRHAHKADLGGAAVIALGDKVQLGHVRLAGVAGAQVELIPHSYPGAGVAFEDIAVVDDALGGGDVQAGDVVKAHACYCLCLSLFD